MKLGMVTKEKCLMLPTSFDQELVIKHEQGRLLCIMTKHVDDLKLTGRKEVIDSVLHAIQEVFGDLKIVA